MWTLFADVEQSVIWGVNMRVCVCARLLVRAVRGSTLLLPSVSLMLESLPLAFEHVLISTGQSVNGERHVSVRLTLKKCFCASRSRNHKRTSGW